MKIIHLLTLLVGVGWLVGIFSIHYVLPVMALDHLIPPETLKTIPLDEQSQIYHKLKGMYKPSKLPSIGSFMVILLGASGLFLDFRIKSQPR